MNDKTLRKRILDHVPDHAVASLQESLSERRYEHCMRVSETAFTIMDAWENLPVNSTALAWAGLFHDCAKEFSPEEQQRWLKQYGPCPYGEELLDTPNLVHAALATLVLRERYGIGSPEILMAAAYHSTGHPELTPVGWIVYMADYLEPGRTFVNDREAILSEVYENPILGLRRVTELRHSLTSGKGTSIHPVALRFREYIDSLDPSGVEALVSD